MRYLLVALAAAALLASGPRLAVAKTIKAAPAKHITKQPQPEVVASAFQTFCEEWMHKLQERERDNVGHIKWDQVADGVQGSYVGYNQEHTCKVIEGTEADPVGKILYREVHYTKHGASGTEAEQCQPEPTEIYDVQEIFHYLKGKWDY